MRLLVLIVIALLAGCASTPSLPPNIVTALKADAANLDQAAAIGAIPADDPAPACVHDILRKVGIEGKSKAFAPDPAGKLSTAYILLRHRLQISPACYALYGEMQFNALRDAVRLGVRLP